MDTFQMRGDHTTISRKRKFRQNPMHMRHI